MATNVIKQIVKDGEYGSQTIKMIVHPNERGAQGEKGDTGEAATITAGQAYSVPAGAQPSVINVGTENNAEFDFYIPKGEKGEKGDTGVAPIIMTDVDPGEGSPLEANHYIAFYT